MPHLALKVNGVGPVAPSDYLAGSENGRPAPVPFWAQTDVRVPYDDPTLRIAPKRIVCVSALRSRYKVAPHAYPDDTPPVANLRLSAGGNAASPSTGWDPRRRYPIRGQCPWQAGRSN